MRRRHSCNLCFGAFGQAMLGWVLDHVFLSRIVAQTCVVHRLH